MDAVDKALQVLKLTRKFGQMSGTILANQPGWNRVLAHRYLTHLNNNGWLEKVTDKGHPVYVLGREAMNLGFTEARLG